MTAINMFCQPRARAGYVMADCAVLDVGGVYREACSKVAISIGRFPFAIGLTGNVHPHVVLKALGEVGFANMKQLSKRLPAAMKMALAAGSANLRGLKPVLALKGVAWDFTRKAPCGFIISSDERILPGVEPFVFYETAWNFTVHDEAENLEQLVGAGVDPTDPRQFDPEIDGLKLMENQRANGTTCLMPGMEGVKHTVGAGVHLYTVTKHGVTSDLICDWQDEIGKPITPASRAVSSGASQLAPQTRIV